MEDEGGSAGTIVPMIQPSLTRYQQEHLHNDEDTKVERTNCEQITLIWLDHNIGTSSEFTDDFALTEHVLRQLNDYVLLFSDTSECIRHIQTIKNETVILIVAGSSASTEVLVTAQNLRHVDSVVIFCQHKDAYQSLLSRKQYSKLVNIFNDQKSLRMGLVHLIEQINRQSALFSLYDPKKQKLTRDLSRESGSFLFLQLVKKIIEKMAIKPNAMRGSRTEMLEKCRLYYRDNAKELENIDRFEREYTPDQAVTWYTNNSFVYKLINKALRTEDIDALYTYRFYVVDLCKCLAKHCELLKEFGPKMKLFRGMKMSETELEQLRNGVGKLIVVNGFLSTSRKCVVAKAFAGVGAKANETLSSVNLQSVIFEIQLDLETYPNIILADVQHLSAHRDEEEVLFDLGAVFKIRAIKFNQKEHCWRCFVSASDEAWAIVKEYYDFKQMESERSNDIEVTFGNLLYEMGEWHKGLKYFQNLLTLRPNEPKIHFGIARCYHALSQQVEALSHYTHAYQLCTKENTVDRPLIAKTCWALTRTHHDVGDFQRALAFGNEALQIYAELDDDQHILDKAKTLVNVGLVHFDLGDDQESFDYLYKGLRLLQSNFSFDHPEISDCLSHLSFAHYHLGNYDAALDCLFQSLEIDQRLLPPDHPNLSAVENNIGKQYYKQGKYQQALERFVRAAEIDVKSSTDSNEGHIVVLNNLGKVSYRLEEYDLASVYYDDALKLIDTLYSVSSDHIYRAYTMKNKGEIELARSHYSSALELFEQAHDMYRRIFPDKPHHRDLGKCQLLIGQAYNAMGDKTKALEAFNRAREIWTVALHPNHPDLALVHQWILNVKD